MSGRADAIADAYDVGEMATQPKGVVAAGHTVTAQAAAEILAEGGNAFDAALAGLAAACVPEVVLASIGGGGFLMAHVAARDETILYDFFADTPLSKGPLSDLDFRAIEADFGPATQEFHIGAGATATPGFVPGLYAVHGDLCTLPMERLLEPAIRTAREGVEMSAFHAYLFTVIAPILTASEAARALFAPGGRLLEAGETYRNPALADTLEALAREGEALFREGAVGKAIVAQSRELGGYLTQDDLARYRVARRKPLSWRFRESSIAFNPPPAASGALIALGLALAHKRADNGEGLDAAALAEIMAETNRARARLAGDRVFDEAALSAHLAALEGATLASRGTTHISVIDAAGNAAAGTISNGEGNGLLVDDYGFMLNNMLGEEDLNPGGFHCWRPGTRLSSMMAPTLVRMDDGGLIALGSGGSNRIRTAILQVLLNLLAHGMALEEAVAAPRIHLEKCGTLSLEGELEEGQKSHLIAAHGNNANVWPERNMFFGGVHAAARWPDGRLEGAGDPRRSGVVLLV